MSRITQGGGAVIGLLIATVAAFEGLSLVAYRDPVGVYTVCYGETEGVKPGDRHTLQECKDMLATSLEKYARGIERCVRAPLPTKRYVALVSFAYNVGISAACGSSVVRLINAGRTREGCDALLKWNRAGPFVLSGLTKRRQKERQLCLSELPA